MKLLSLPMGQDVEDARSLDLSVTFMIKNDHTKVAILDTDATASTPATQVKIAVGEVRTINISDSSLSELLSGQSVSLFEVTHE